MRECASRPHAPASSAPPARWVLSPRNRLPPSRAPQANGRHRALPYRSSSSPPARVLSKCAIRFGASEGEQPRHSQQCCGRFASAHSCDFEITVVQFRGATVSEVHDGWCNGRGKLRVTHDGPFWHERCRTPLRLREVRLPPRPLCVGTFHFVGWRTLSEG